MQEKNNLSYTRYSDDITFSTNANIFPIKLAYVSISKGKKTTTISPLLNHLIRRSGFKINKDKVYLLGQDSRIKVTGLVINNKINIDKREFKRIRGIVGYINRYRDKSKALMLAKKRYKKFIPWATGEIDDQVFLRWLRGKIYYIRYIKGDYDPKYIKLAREYSKIDRSFNYCELPSLNRLEVFLHTEGKTDEKHISAAIKACKALGKFTDLNLVIDSPRSPSRGSAPLMEEYERFSTYYRGVSDLHIFLFDRDEQDIISKFSKKSFLNAKNSAYALMLPKPTHYQEIKTHCIEHYYSIENIKSMSLGRKRIYLRHEFDRDGWSEKKDLIYTLHGVKNAIVASSRVFDVVTKEDVALSKDAFADIAVSTIPQGEIDLGSFEKLFSLICEIREDYYNNFLKPLTVEKKKVKTSD